MISKSANLSRFNSAYVNRRTGLVVLLVIVKDYATCIHLNLTPNVSRRIDSEVVHRRAPTRVLIFAVVIPWPAKVPHHTILTGDTMPRL